jgi:hypothetical protein
VLLPGEWVVASFLPIAGLVKKEVLGVHQGPLFVQDFAGLKHGETHISIQVIDKPQKIVCHGRQSQSPSLIP